MTARRVVLLLTGLCLLAAVGAGAVQQQRSRLVVRNGAGAVAEVSQFVRGKWEFRGRVYPGDSTVVTDVSNGDRFRAEWRGGVAEHVVRLAYDKSYGGYQDTWVVRR